jgi:hypothetical protein
MISMEMNNGRLTTLAKARHARRRKIPNSVAATEIPAQDRLSHLAPARRASVEDRLSQMPNHCRNTYLRALGGRSPRSAIKAFCLECVSWQRAEVVRCTAQACPLWSYRPFRKEATS